MKKKTIAALAAGGALLAYKYLSIVEQYALAGMWNNSVVFPDNVLLQGYR